MIVDVKGFGPIKFPDTMSEAEVRSVLRQFEPKKDDTQERLLTALVDAVKKIKPQIVTQKEPYAVEKQVVVKEPQIVEIEKPSKYRPVPWRFTIEREDGEITEILAEPLDD